MTFESSSFDKDNSNAYTSEGTEIPLNNNGGTCVIYKINLHGKWVVLKRIKPEYIGNPVIEKSFEKEFEIGFSLDHPHIIKYINKGDDKNGVFIITEYVDGKTLREHLNSGTVFSREQTHKIIVQLFEAIIYLHKKNIIHLDLKPENILISDKTGNVKLIDFGFSYSDGQLYVASGTKKYISPEQSVKPENVNCNNDLYSLGIIIIELFTGKTDLKGAKQLPNNYKKVVKQCLDCTSEHLVSADKMLVVLNKKPINTKVYLIAGLIVLFSSFFLWKNNIREEKLVEPKSIESKTNWIALPTMPKGRADGGVINYGNKIYYFTGVGANVGLTVYDNFVYDIDKKQWTKLNNNIKCARAEVGIVELHGKVYVFGGWLGNAVTDTSEVYDIKTGKWELLPPLPKKITGLSATTCNGKIYVIGGTLDVTNTYLFEFDPIKKTYTQLPIFDKSRMNSFLVTKGDFIYAIGGNSYKDDSYFIHNDCDMYNVKTKTWVMKTSMPEPLTRGAVCISGNKIHYLGGTPSVYVEEGKHTKAHYIFDTETEVWTNGEILPYNVCSNECVAIGNKIYLLGGYEKMPNASSKVLVLKQ